MKQKYPIAVVHCRDQTFWTGVIDPRTEKFEVSEMIIVGQVLHHDEDRIVLVLEHFDDGDVRYVSAVPKENVSKMQILGTGQLDEQKQE